MPTTHQFTEKQLEELLLGLPAERKTFFLEFKNNHPLYKEVGLFEFLMGLFKRTPDNRVDLDESHLAVKQLADHEAKEREESQVAVMSSSGLSPAQLQSSLQQMQLSMVEAMGEV
eukprot:Nk52_evm1s625 gene=Nk52_evmTU1s625